MNVSIVGDKCTACRACGQSCPVGAISFAETKEGFAYPLVSDACVDCGKCLRVCHTQADDLIRSPGSAYAAYIKDSVLLQKSTSGGIFAALARSFLKSGGVVFGCREILPGVVRHCFIEKEEELSFLQGSKYVESDMTDVYSEARRFLEERRTVLFSGTPCQVAGLKSFLGGDRDGLYTVDIVCHGVPSQKLYREYLAWEGERRGAKVEGFAFRSKKKHGWSLTYKMELKKNGRVLTKEHFATLSPYYDHFLKGFNYRESCYRCRYARPERVGDITLCDFWGIDEIVPEMNNPGGVSGVLIGSNKGTRLWDGVRDEITQIEVEIEKLVNRNGQLYAPSKRPETRDRYYSEIEEGGFAGVAEKYTPLKERIVDSIKDIMPNGLRLKIKRIISRVRR